MKVFSFNQVDSSIIGRAENIIDQYFKKIDISVGLFQSTDHKYIEWCEGLNQKRAPAVTIYKERFDLQKIIFPEISKLKNHLKSVSPIIWFGKSLHQNKKYNIDQIVAHELKHVEQASVDLVSFHKDRVLNFIFTEKKTPCDIDATNFECMTVSKDFDKKYDWIKEVQKLFSVNIDKVKQINQAIDNKNEYINVKGECFLDLGKDQEKRDLFQYHFKLTGTE